MTSQTPVTFRVLTLQTKKNRSCCFSNTRCQIQQKETQHRTLLGWRSRAQSLIRVRERACLVIQNDTTHRKDSRKLDSHGNVSSGCPGRHSHSCRRPGEQNPGCPRDPGLSGRPPCSLGSGYTVHPGSVPEQEHISDMARKQGIKTKLCNMKNCIRHFMRLWWCNQLLFLIYF